MGTKGKIILGLKFFFEGKGSPKDEEAEEGDDAEAPFWTEVACKVCSAYAEDDTEDALDLP